MRVLLLMLLAGCAAARSPMTDAAMPSTTLDVVGAWDSCAATITFAADGSAAFASYKDGCSSSGHYVVDGEVVTLDWSAGGCATVPSGALTGVRTTGGLILIDVATGMTSHYADAATPRARWRLDGTSGGTAHSTTLRVIGTPGVGLASACYWSTDLACGGIFSCGGGVSVWNVDATHWHVTTTCNGECPCGAVIDGTVAADGTVTGTYHGADCGGVIDGPFTATPIPDR